METAAPGKGGDGHKVGEWLREGLEAADLEPGDPAGLKGTDPRKAVLADLLWRHTTLSQTWLAEKLHLHSAANVSQVLRRTAPAVLKHKRSLPAYCTDAPRRDHPRTAVRRSLEPGINQRRDFCQTNPFSGDQHNGPEILECHGTHWGAPLLLCGYSLPPFREQFPAQEADGAVAAAGGAMFTATVNDLKVELVP